MPSPGRAPSNVLSPAPPTTSRHSIPAIRRRRSRCASRDRDVITDAAGDIFGDGVNIAARLQEFADPGGIIISEAIHDLVHGHLGRDALDLGLLQLKNIERPVHAFMLDASRQRPATPTLSARQDLPSIAVLPLQNRDGGPGEDYFAEGIVEDITVSLASLHELLVISRGSHPRR